MANVVLTVLSITVGLFFIISGTLKLNPIISDEIYKEMRKIFIRTAKVVPFVKLFGLKLDPHLYRKVVGVTEVVCGLLLTVVPGMLKQVANVILMFVVAVMIYTHYMLGDGLNKTTPLLIFGMLLACRFIVYLQVLLREREEAASKSSDADDTSRNANKHSRQRQKDE